MNRTRKIGWLALGIGGLLLAIVSVRMGQSSRPTATVSGKNAEQAQEQKSGLVAPEDVAPEITAEDSKPEISQLKPLAEIPAPERRHIPKNAPRPMNAREDSAREFRVQDKTEKIPEVKDTPPIKLSEPGTLDNPQGAPKQAWNEFESDPPADPPIDNGGDWQPTPEAEPSIPADDFAGDPPPPPPDMGGDFQPEPVDNFDYGGTGE